MSSFLSPAYSETKIQETFDVNLADKVLSARQGKYDVNKAKVDATLAAVKNLRGRRDFDNEYIAERIKETESMINGYGNKDYSLNSTAGAFEQSIKAITDDPIVRGAILNKAKLDKYDADYEERVKKGDGSANVDNYNFGLYRAGNDAYMKGETNNIGSLNYISYIDKTKVALETMKTLKDLRGKELIKVVDPMDEKKTISKSIEGLTATEIFKYLPELLPPTVNAQMEVDAWKKYQGNEKQADADLAEYTTAEFNKLNESLALKKAASESVGLTSDNKKKAITEYENLKKEIENATENSKTLNSASFLQKAKYLEKKNWMATVANAAQAKMSYEEGNNENYFAVEKLKMDTEEHLSKMAKEKLEIEKLQGEVDETNGTGNTSVISKSARTGELVKNVNPFSDQETEYATVTESISTDILNSAKSGSAPASVVEHFNKLMLSKGYDKNGNVVKGKDAIAAKTSKTDALYEAYTESNMSKYDSKTTKKVHEANTQRDFLSTSVTTTKGSAIKANWEKNKELYIDDILATGVPQTIEYSLDSFSQVFKPRVKTEYLKGILKESGISEDSFLKMVNDDLFNGKRSQARNVISSYIDSHITNYLDAKTVNTNLTKLAEASPLFKEHVGITANATLKKNTQSGKSGYFNTENLLTIEAGKDTKYIVDRLPQDAISDNFDKEKPISFYINKDRSINILQNGGLGIDKEGAIKNKAPKFITIGVADDLHSKLMGYVQENNNRENTDASRVKRTIMARKNQQEFLPEESGDEMKESATDVVLSIPNLAKVFGGEDPKDYLFKADSENLLLQKFGDVVGKDKITQLMNAVSSNMGKVDLKIEPVQEQWTLSTTLPNKKNIMRAKTNMKTIDPNFNSLFLEYPQVIIMHSLVSDLKNCTTPEQLKEKVDYYINNFK